MESINWLQTFHFLWVWRLSISHKRVKNEELLFLHNVESTIKQHTNSFKYSSNSHSTEKQQGTMLYFIYTIVYKKLRKKKHTFYLSSGNLVIFQYTILFSFHISLQGKKKFIYSSRYEKRWLSGKLFCDLHVFKTTTSKSTRKLCYIYGTRMTNWYNINNSF